MADRVVLRLPMRVEVVTAVLSALAGAFPTATCGYGDDRNMFVDIPDETDPAVPDG